MSELFAASKQGPLAIGERLYDLPFLNTAGQAISLYADRIFGLSKAIVMAPTAAAAEAELASFLPLLAEFEAVGTQVVAVTGSSPKENAALLAKLGVNLPLLSDPDGSLHQAAGLDDGTVSTLMFDPVLRLEARFGPSNEERQAAAALAHARARLDSYPPTVVGAQAPVLVVPNILDTDHCRRLIDYWEAAGKETTTVARAEDGVTASDARTKVRSDVNILEGTPEAQELAGTLSRRLLPEIYKAFNFRVSRIEHFRIGCYVASDGGHFAPHRDNTTPATAHRRYALTLNLNTGEYEGGYLRLPEYGPQLYAPPTGGAAVFSCSLLHLAMPVTKGRRFALITFFWSEAEQKILEQNLAKLAD